MGKAIPTVEGWHSQHMVFSMDFSAWNCFDAEEKAEVLPSAETTVLPLHGHARWRDHPDRTYQADAPQRYIPPPRAAPAL